jgi:hypothetical protein
VEENETFALWIRNTAAGSPTTAIENGRVLSRFLDLMGRTLDDLMKNVRADKPGFESRLELFARGLESQGYKKGYMTNYFKRARSFQGICSLLVCLVKDPVLLFKSFVWPM